MKLRLDKYLADMGVGTRSEVKTDIRRGNISVNGKVTKSPELKIDTEKDQVFFKGNAVGYAQYAYYMLNKPAGVVSATEDHRDKTVLDLITDKQRKDLFPVGRLDKDTEGLLLITNDGELSHRLLSPKKHVPKVYYARIEGIVTEDDIRMFKNGVRIDDGIDDPFTALPAKLKIKSVDLKKNQSEIEVEIVEGKYHQVKRMFEAVHKKVVYLKRLSMGSLVLDESLKIGEYRLLTEAELDALKNCQN